MSEHGTERLQKIIAQAGLASRRKAETMIQTGRVRVNGQVVTELGSQADPRRDKIEVDGRRIQLPKAWTYVLLYKPTGVVTTAADEFQRKTVLDLVTGVDARLFPVGRLDLDTEGVLLLTNDGQLGAGLSHPSSEIRKTYQAKVKGEPSKEAVAKLMSGVILEDGSAQALEAFMLPRTTEANTWIEITVVEGRNHLIKRMCDAIGHPVLKLRRTKFAGLDLEGLRPRRWRHLRRDELRKLRTLARAGQKKRGAKEDDA